MDIHHLRIFAAVYKQKSFTKASKQLDITQPTISEHVKNLEQELGCRLFDRLGRTIIPTREGDLLYPRALEIMNEMQQLFEDLTEAEGRVKGELVIGASTIPGVYILPSLAMKFKKIYPEVRFEIIIEDTARITSKVENHELFCGIVGARMDGSHLEYHPFVKDELVLIGVNEFAGIPQKPTDLKKMPFVMRERGSGTRKFLENLLYDNKINMADLDIAATLGSTAAVKEALKAGMGVSIISRLAVREEIADGRLREITVKGLKMTRDFYLIGHKKRTLPQHYRLFYDFLKKSY